ncbi:MAG: peptidylprolyl isomerase [Candidatus Latescibacterota bacterium]
MSILERGKATGICALLLWCGCRSQQAEPYVARVGDEGISVEEFESRARRLLKRGYHGLDSLDQEDKAKLLEAMIAQEVLVLEAVARGYDRDPAVVDEIERAEEKAVIDTLYNRQASRGPYTFTEEEVERFQHERGYDVRVRSEQLVCGTAEEARAALGELQAGATFAALVPRYSLPPIRERFGPAGDIGWLLMADMLEELKQPMGALEVGQLTPQPVPTRLGHHVFRLTGRQVVPLDSVRTQVEKQLRLQRVARDRQRYVEELRRRYAMEAHGDALKRILSLPPDQKTWPGQEEPLFTWKGGQFTAGDYLTKHRLGRVRHPASLDSAQLHRLADNLAGQRIMKAEARKLGYDQEPVVRRAVQDRRRELLVQELFRHEGQVDPSEIPQEEVQAYYDENLERFAGPGGQTAALPKVQERIRRTLRHDRENQTMDQLIEELRRKYQDRIETRSEVLAQAFAP